MAERGLGLGPVSFAPLIADGPPRPRRSDVAWSGPMFELVAGTLDRTLWTGSGWSTTASFALHVAVVVIFVAMLPAIGVITMPTVPTHIAGFIAPMPSPPPPPLPAEPAAEEPTQPSEPPPPVDDPVFAAPISGPRTTQPVLLEWGVSWPGGGPASESLAQCRDRRHRRLRRTCAVRAHLPQQALTARQRTLPPRPLLATRRPAGAQCVFSEHVSSPITASRFSREGIDVCSST